MNDIDEHIKKYLLEFDEESDAILALEILLNFMRSAQKDKRYWVWVFISLHKSVQCFMVLALQGTDSCRLLDSTKNSNKPNMYRFLELYSRIKNPEYMKQYTDSHEFQATARQNRSIKLLNTELRNNFIHFSPKSWLIELAGMSTILVDCLDIIEFLALKAGNVFWNNKSEEQQLIKLLRNLRMNANRLRTIYG